MEKEDENANYIHFRGLLFSINSRGQSHLEGVQMQPLKPFKRTYLNNGKLHRLNGPCKTRVIVRMKCQS